MSKGSIVWYWHWRKKEWKKGKIISINKHWGPFLHPRGLWVKDRSSKLPFFVPIYYPAVSASEAKPATQPQEPWYDQL